MPAAVKIVIFGLAHGAVVAGLRVTQKLVHFHNDMLQPFLLVLGRTSATAVRKNLKSLSGLSGQE